MSVDIKRGLLTDAVLAAAANSGFPIGDAEAPDDGGWQGEINKSNFVPYSVVTPTPSQRITGPITGPNDDVVFTYVLTSFGVSRKQCELMADAVRAAVRGLKGTDVEMGHTRRVQYVGIESFGQVSRLDQVEPAYYAQSDTVSVYTTV